MTLASNLIAALICASPSIALYVPTRAAQDELTLKVPPGAPFKPDDLHFMRISKAGSTTIHDALLKTKNRHCDRVRFHRHNFVAEVLTRYHPESANFVILRNPCDRFVSQTFHLKRIVENSGLGYEFLQDYDFKASDPIKFGHDLSTDRALYENYFWNGELSGNGDRATAPGLENHQIIFKQSYYVNNKTEFACLPTLEADVSRILQVHAPGCTLDLATHANVREDSRELKFKGDPSVCRITEALYPEDWKLWREHCNA